MASMTATDVNSLRQAIEEDVETIDVHLVVPRNTAQLLLRLIEARHRGEFILVPVHTEYTPNEAAMMLGVSRPQVYKLIDAGRLACRMVGTHRRIPATSIVTFLTEQRAAQREAMSELARMSNELGLTE